MYVVHSPNMWCRGRSISERSPSFISSVRLAESMNVSIPATVSSAPRGTDVVPDVNIIIDVAAGSNLASSFQTLSESRKVRLTLSRNFSVLIDPNAATVRPGTCLATVRALFSCRDE